MSGFDPAGEPLSHEDPDEPAATGGPEHGGPESGYPAQFPAAEMPTIPMSETPGFTAFRNQSFEVTPYQTPAFAGPYGADSGAETRELQPVEYGAAGYETVEHNAAAGSETGYHPTTHVIEPEPEDAGDRPRSISAKARGGDRAFLGVMSGSGIFVLAVILTIGGFLGFRSWQALRVAGLAFFTTQEWQPGISAHGPVSFGVAGLLVGTVLIGVTAILVALPIAFGTALFISEYAPAGLKRTAITLIDLMAAIPSVVYGLWGFLFLLPKGEETAHWISTYFGWIPLFTVNGTDPSSPFTSLERYSDSTFIAGGVVGMMITPIVCSMMRESFSQAPLGEREGAYALGATKWGMIRTVVLPFGRGGIIGGAMLGLGRALGETIAVVMIISLVFQIQPHVLQSGAASVSALIASHFASAEPFEISGLMAAGLALFLLTLVINLVASSIIARSRSGQESG